ncbi:RnfABCDGE type electron transport complex subunit D [Omnitrophica bacterium]|nr:RnfABCDGE type electron transport complex subunit D [Candidatus Omnitrophota bacterium]
MPEYVKSSAPHIQSSASIPKKFWGMSLALTPVLLALPFYAGAHFLRAAFFSLLGAFLAELTGKIIFKRAASLGQGSFFCLGILFCLMLPPTLPSWLIVVGSFFGVFAGKELTGGNGSGLFHPPALGYAMIYASFPKVLNFHIALHLPGLGEIHWAFILTACLALLWVRLVRWEIPLIFILISSLVGLLFAAQSAAQAFSARIFLAAFFYLMVPGLGPLARSGRRMFSAGAALLFSLFSQYLPFFAALSFSLLWMNAFTPWLDEWFRPRLSRLARGL